MDATWKVIQSDPIYRDKTTLMVTNDHGRHNTDEWYNHGCGCDGCRHIMMLMIGPDTKAGIVDTTHRTLIDLTPTVGELLDFSTPQCQGTPLIPIRPPAVPAPIAPANDAIHQPLTMSLQWNTVKRASLYHVQLTTDSSFTDLFTDDSLLTWNTRSVGPLDINTRYYWRIRSKNSGGASAWSPTRQFITVPTMPPRVTLSNPENAMVITRDTVQFFWTATAVSEVDRYELVVALDSLMTKRVFVDSQIPESSRQHYCTRNKTVFWWRVRAHYQYGWASWSSTRRFFVDFPVVIKPPKYYTIEVENGRDKTVPLLVRYSLPTPSAVSIRIFSLSGKYRGTLVDSWQTTDSYAITIPLRSLARGYYLLDFQAGPFRSTHRFHAY